MLSDTDPQTMRVWMEMWRNATPQRRLALGRAQSRWCMRASKAAIRRAHPGYSDAEVDVAFVRLHFGKDLADGVAGRLGVRVER